MATQIITEQTRRAGILQDMKNCERCDWLTVVGSFFRSRVLLDLKNEPRKMHHHAPVVLSLVQSLSIIMSCCDVCFRIVQPLDWCWHQHHLTKKADCPTAVALTDTRALAFPFLIVKLFYRCEFPILSNSRPLSIIPPRINTNGSLGGGLRKSSPPSARRQPCSHWLCRTMVPKQVRQRSQYYRYKVIHQRAIRLHSTSGICS